MKHFFIFLIFLQNAIFYFASAQVVDDFSDGDLDANPAWSGDIPDFTINTEGQLQLNAPAVAGTSCLSTQSKIISNATWTFYLKLDFNPSSSNYLDVYLVSDVQDLEGTLNGYFVRIGNTQDEVSLYQQTGEKGSAIKIIDGMDGRVSSSTVELNIQVTRSLEDTWELLVDPDLSSSYISEGTVTDGTHFFSRFFGVYCKYTSTRSDRFYFDNLSIIGDAYVDELAPAVDSIIVLSDSTIQVSFNEKIIKPNPGNFSVNNGIGSPINIVSSSDSSSVLHYQFKFSDGIINDMSITGIQDLFGNTSGNSIHHFVYHAPYVVGFGDILITEIMADPTPGVDLPEYEYLEIHNPKGETFDLFGLILVVGNDTTKIPDLTIKAGEYIILCQSAALDHLLSYGRSVKVSNWPSLNNRGEQIVLLNKYQEVVFSLHYDDSWYRSIEKDDGGFSLEMKDTDFPCKASENWTASRDPAGGTPGKENNHDEKLNDLLAPEIERVIALSEREVSIRLNENIGPQEILISDVSIEPSLSVSQLELSSPGFSEIKLELMETLKPKTVYTLEIKNISDCAGNVQKGSTSQVILPETADSLDLIINEILFDPKPGGVDFVEIYNQSDKFIDFNSISLQEEVFEPITIDHFILGPDQFIVITEDAHALNNQYPGIDMSAVLTSESIPSYNNDQGDVYLVNDLGKMIDYVHYKEDFHSEFLDDVEGVSLERISFSGVSNNPDNWHSASSTVGFATPGKMNSQAQGSDALDDAITIEPIVFAPGINGFNDFTMIKCRFPTTGNMANIQILDRTGRQIKTILSHQSIGIEEDFKWEGLDDKGQEVQMGPYIVYVEIYNASGERKLYRKKVVVGKMLN